ncbi:MAG: PAS domain-containing protein [Hyphomonas sp.]
MQEREIFYENHPDPMWIYDLDTLKFLDVNTAAIAAYGYSREEFLALRATDIRPPEDIPAFLESIRSAGTRRCEVSTFRHRRKSGEVFFVQITAQLIDWQGRRAELVSVRDVNRAVTLELEREGMLRREASLRAAAEASAGRLAEQVANLRIAQRLIGMAVWKFEAWSGRLTWSPELFRMSRVEEAAFGHSFEAYAALVHPDDRQAMADHFHAFLASDAAQFEFAHRIVRPDATVIHVRGVAEAADTPHGRLLTGMVRDVTAEVEQGERLRLLDLSVSRLNDIVVIFEAHPGPQACRAPVVYVNAALTRITGRTEAEILGRSILAVMTETAPGVPAEVLDQALAAEVSMRSDIRLFTKDHRVLQAEIDLVPVRNPAGAMTHWVAVMRDMTDKQSADARALINEERYQMLARSTHDVVWDWDIRSGVLTWNENFRDLAGDPDAPLADRLTSWSNRLHPDDHDRVLEDFHGAIAGTGEAWSDEYRFVRDDGDIRFAFDRGFISRDEAGRGVRIVGSIVDITARKTAEARLAQAEKLEALGQITGGVAHDFNNLLMIILGNAETLLDQAEDARERRLLELVFAAAERGRDLTGRLLAFARRSPLKPEPLDINQQVLRSAELLRRTFRANIRIETDLRAPKVNVISDPAQLELVLLNLAVNARDSMKEGGVLTLATEHVEHGGAGRVVLTISDTGTGMDAETLRRCLDPFFTTRPVGQGVGLGLSMAFGFMEQTGGALRIASEPGKGTQVSLDFPQAEDAAAPRAPAPSAAMVGGDELILLVEDDAGVRHHVHGVLTGLGYRVAACESGDEAIRYLQAGGSADLIFSDLVMPGSTDVRHVVQAARERFADIPVLYTSGYPKEMIDRDGRLPGDIELLAKPYRRAELAARLRALLDPLRAARGAAPAGSVQSEDV